MEAENTTTSTKTGSSFAHQQPQPNQHHPQPLRKAVPVPSTDLRSALSAIENDATRLHLQLNSTINSQPTESERILLETKITANASLRSNIARLVKPVDERIHEETLQRVREELRGKDVGNGNDVNLSDESDVWDDISDDDLSCIEEEEEEEVDESEMIDQDALARVKSLREEVRNIANRVADKTNDVTGRAVRLAGKEVESMRTMGSLTEEEDGGEGEHNSNNADPFPNDSDPTQELSNTNATRIASMKATLQSLSESVAKIESGGGGGNGSGGSGTTLPTAVEDLQSTVDTVAAALAKARLRREEGDDVALSQTERAILSKPEKERGGEDAENDIRAAEARARIAGMGPDERFAAFMASTGGSAGGV